MARAMIKIQETKRPISKEVIGYRLMAAVENEASTVHGKPAPSFRGVYLVTEGSDLPSITRSDVKRFMDELRRWHGFDSFVAVGEVADLMVGS